MSDTKQDHTDEELKQQAQLKQWLEEKFSFPKISNEKTNELVKGMSSLLHATATMIVRTETRQFEGMRAIDKLQEVLLYYISGQTAKVVKPE